MGHQGEVNRDHVQITRTDIYSSNTEFACMSAAPIESISMHRYAFIDLPRRNLTWKFLQHSTSRVLNVILSNNMYFTSRISKVQWIPTETPDMLQNFLMIAEKDLVLLNVADPIRVEHILPGCGRYGLPVRPINFDWGIENDPSVAGVYENNTTKVWDVNTQREMYSMVNKKVVTEIKRSLGGGIRNAIAFGSMDGSLLLCDNRQPPEQTVVHQMESHFPITNIRWNKFVMHILAINAQNEDKIHLIDLRLPNRPFLTLVKEDVFIQDISWSPKDKFSLCSVGDGGLLMVWDFERQDTSQNPCIQKKMDNDVLVSVHWDWVNRHCISFCSRNHSSLLVVEA